MRHLSLIRAAPAGALVLLASGGLGGCISTATYGTGEAPESTLLSEATGGLFDKDEEKAQIDYEPRAPLVVPPAAQLPEPAPPPSQLAAGDWPVEPVEEELEIVMSEGGGAERRAMSPEYVRRMGPLARLMNRGRGERVKMSEVGAARSFLTEQNGAEEFAAALAEADGLSSSERRYLTDPPSHYREPAETAPTEFEDIEDKKDGNFLTRLLGL